MARCNQAQSCSSLTKSKVPDWSACLLYSLMSYARDSALKILAPGKRKPRIDSGVQLSIHLACALETAKLLLISKILDQLACDTASESAPEVRICEFCFLTMMRRSSIVSSEVPRLVSHDLSEFACLESCANHPRQA